MVGNSTRISDWISQNLLLDLESPVINTIPHNGKPIYCTTEDNHVCLSCTVYVWCLKMKVFCLTWIFIPLINGILRQQAGNTEVTDTKPSWSWNYLRRGHIKNGILSPPRRWHFVRCIPQCSACFLGCITHPIEQQVSPSYIWHLFPIPFFQYTCLLHQSPSAIDYLRILLPFLLIWAKKFLGPV